MRVDSQKSTVHLPGVIYRTRQREAIMQVLRREGTPLSAQTVLSKAVELCPSIGAATVFRALRQLVDSGEISRVKLPGLPPHYELTSERHHHFFVCEICNRLQPMELSLDNISGLLPTGSRMRSHELVIFGECAGCVSD